MLEHLITPCLRCVPSVDALEQDILKQEGEQSYKSINEVAPKAKDSNTK